jgi:hypothetical protein
MKLMAFYFCITLKLLHFLETRSKISDGRATEEKFLHFPLSIALD